MAKLVEITGKALSGEWGTDDIEGTGIHVLRTTNFTNDGVINYENVVTRIIKRKNIEEKYLRYGDIIIEKSGGSDKQPVGRVVFFDGPENKYLFNNFTGLLRIKDKKKWSPKYVFYSLFSNYRRGGTRAFENKTTGLHNLKTDDFVLKYEVNDRSIEEQKVICEKLDTIQGIIKQQEEQLIRFENLIKSRFVEMFGDPVINQKGWNRVFLGQLCEIGSSKRIFEREYVVEGIPFYRTKEIVELSKGYNVSTELFITKDRYNEIKEKYGVPRKNDLLISAVGTIGRIWIVDGKQDFYFKDGNLIRIEASSDFNSVYMKYLLEELIKNYKNEMSTGTAYSALTISGLKEMSVYDVPLSLQEQFSAFVHKVDKLKAAEQKRLEKLQLLFDSLMQKYFG